MASQKIMDIHYIVQHSAESTLLSIERRENVYILLLEMPELMECLSASDSGNDELVQLTVPEKHFNINAVSLRSPQTCYLRLINLAENLSVNQWGYYAPADDKNHISTN